MLVMEKTHDCSEPQRCWNCIQGFEGPSWEVAYSFIKLSFVKFRHKWIFSKTEAKQYVLFFSGSEDINPQVLENSFCHTVPEVWAFAWLVQPSLGTPLTGGVLKLPWTHVVLSLAVWQCLGHCPLPFTQDCFKQILPHKCPKALLSTTSCINVLSSPPALYSVPFAFCNPYGRQTDEIKMLASFLFCLWHRPSQLFLKPVSSILPQFSKSALPFLLTEFSLESDVWHSSKPWTQKSFGDLISKYHSCPVDLPLAISVSLVLP